MHEIVVPRSRVSRLLATSRHPEQAAIAARLPLLGRRVPLRPYWRRRKPQAGRVSGVVSVLRAVAAELPVRETAVRTAQAVEGGARAAAHRSPGVRAAIRGGAHTVVDRAQDMSVRVPAVPRPALRAGTWPSLFVALSAGALAMYYLDPAQGRRRRALVRDRFAHLGHLFRDDVPRRIERRGRFFRGVARGISHDAGRLVHHNGHAYLVDSETLVARVRSEILRDGRVKAGEIHLDAYEGCVTLRGQVDRESEARRLIDATRRVTGVTDVRSYLHLPDEPPPNKAESYEHAVRELPAI